MKLIDAIKSGKPYRRTSSWLNPEEKGIHFDLEEVLADDWEVRDDDDATESV